MSKIFNDLQFLTTTTYVFQDKIESQTCLKQVLFYCPRNAPQLPHKPSILHILPILPKTLPTTSKALPAASCLIKPPVPVPSPHTPSLGPQPLSPRFFRRMSYLPIISDTRDCRMLVEGAVVDWWRQSISK